MTRIGRSLVHALAIAGIIGGFAAGPAFADHDDHGKRHGKKHHSYQREYRRPQAHYYSRDYDRYAYRRYYNEYEAPRVYVPVPPPPSFGLHLVFPFH